MGLNSVDNVSVGKPKIAGAVYRAPKGTTLPTDATTALDAAFVCLGYVSEDGLTNSNTASTETIKAWGGDIVLTPLTEKPDNFSLTLIESLSKDVLATVYGDDNVDGELATGISIRANSTELPHSAWVVDMVLRGGVMKRVVIADGQVNEVGDIVYKDNEAIAYPLTIAAFPGGADFDNDTHKEYIVSAPAAANDATDDTTDDTTNDSGDDQNPDPYDVP